ncbi:NAD-dependent histone deacetylase sir2 [Xylographa trunciseda]|nr:NAD-dependent histone deacetylase sir2 [Xylographa trunciseda]
MATGQEVKQEVALEGVVTGGVDLESSGKLALKALIEPTTGQQRASSGQESEATDDEEWESESLYEDALDGAVDEEFPIHTYEACTLEEAIAYRKRLRMVGDDQFIIETIEAGTITAKKLCTAFNIRPPAFLEGAPDIAYYRLLGLGITRELQKRVKLPEYNTVDDAVSLLKNSKNIIVLTGAGISTSLGIPDFRSKNTGFYSQLEHLGYSDPQEVFDIENFREDPSKFYSVAKDILPSTNRYSPTHAFIRLLQEKERLLTNYTQNIDNLEGHAGIRSEKLIQCHGSFATASCLDCKYKVKCEEIYKEIKAGQVARCGRCIRRLQPDRASGMKRKRSANGKSHSRQRRKGDHEDSTDDDDYDTTAAGVMKVTYSKSFGLLDGIADVEQPDITFFGESLPSGFHERLCVHDRYLVDLVIVIGTSLKVAPVSEVVGFLPSHVPQMFISRDPCLHVDFDVEMLGDCDVVVAELCRRAGWELKHEMIPEKQAIDVQLCDGYESRYSFKAKTA